MAFRTTFILSALALAALQATAQEAAQTVTVTGRSANPPLGLAGFGDVPLGRLPLSATSIGGPQLQDAGITSLADITRMDAAISDAYNAPGYWSMLAVRGFVLDNRFNYRRDGLPINAETAIALGNKSSIEVLKGLSGIQAGTSSPGGLVNLVVKRPVPALRNASIAWAQDNSLEAAVDLSDRSGADAAFGWRLNASAARLDPTINASEGRRHLVALATDWRFSKTSRLEAEVEISHQRQPSMAGFSVLGNRVPDASAIDPNTNLNNQPWSLPVVLDGRTASLRYTQEINRELSVTVHGMSQHLRSDDRVAFPFGCSAENNYDRYCSDGSFDLYDFRSEGERRRSDALDLSLAWRGQIAGMAHQLGTGVLFSRYQARFNRQAFNWVGIGTIDGLSVTPPDPSLTDENTHRTERSTEWRLQDAITITEDTSLFAGVRVSQLQRDSVRTDGSRPTGYDQHLTTPWLALSHMLSPRDMVYASWGQGVESEVTPNRPRFSNPGQALPAMKSRQIEAGYKRRNGALDGGIALFEVHRPAWSDIGSCTDDEPGSCTRKIDGEARHRGIEAELDWRAGAWNLRGSVMLLRARREGAQDPAINGLKPTNVPERSLKLQAAYNVAALPGLALLGYVTHEGRRAVLPDNSLQIGGWTRVDIGLRYAMKLDGRTLTWRAGIDNLADHRAWKEAPFQFGHAYLYPLPERQVHVSLTADF
ncbi:TonB-dependent siderophore receptor [Aquabacterium sp.]|uniref:TonB-dependent siderophore receptor n=1 Tax=Aquabacterium sp. TaxID=1872578 RepID=UPI002CF96108|nr:TonB-dependent receptor [Aquabacterium sp.]HSW06680.1 TonB-dependent receptor [Aquabacterium sp.]